MERWSNVVGRFNRSLLGEEDNGGAEEEAFLSDSTGVICSLSPLQRMYAFGVSLLTGFVLLLLSLLVIFKPVKFAILFSFGNILSVGSTVFLVGLGHQARMMFDPVRVYASSIYAGSVVVSLLCAFLIQNKILTLLAMIIEICALIWYSLSYIPFARRMASQLLISFCDTEI